jgi:hypothetical protein
MLQTVLGVDAAPIASALLVSPAAIGGNGLSATKSKIPGLWASRLRIAMFNSRKSKVSCWLDKPTSWS